MITRRIRVLTMAVSAIALGATGLHLHGQTVPAQTPAAAAPRSPVRTGGTGKVSGVVKDDTGGVIPGASVALSNGIGILQTVQSGADGTYTFPGVAPGTYTVSATYSGLGQKAPTALTVAAGQSATGNITMILQEQCHRTGSQAGRPGCTAGRSRRLAGRLGSAGRPIGRSGRKSDFY